MKFKDELPLVEGFAASTNSDPEGVDKALKPWVLDASSPDKAQEREAQLQYRLFRAGEAGALDKLKALAAANPRLAEVTLYLHLALQENDEDWA